MMSGDGQRILLSPTNRLELDLCSHLVDDMTARQIANFVWVSNGDVKTRSRCLFNADTRLRLSFLIFNSYGLALGIEPVS